MFQKQRVYIGNVNGPATASTCHRVFIGLLAGIFLMVLAILIGGCSCHERTYSQWVYADESPAVSPKLLLRSPKERPLDPQTFAYRSDWPAAEGDTPLGRVTFSRETWYNYQGLAPCVPDYSYNLFQMYRYGTSVR